MNADDSVAPNKEQTMLVVRKLEELLRNNEVPPKLEEELGMSREQMEHFVQKFKEAPKNDPGPGREIQIKPGESRKFDPNRRLPEVGPTGRVSAQTIRDRGSIVHDQIRDNVQGVRFQIPAELRPGFEAYKSSLSRSKTLNPPRPAAAPGAGGN